MNLIYPQIHLTIQQIRAKTNLRIQLADHNEDYLLTTTGEKISLIWDGGMYPADKETCFFGLLYQDQLPFSLLDTLVQTCDYRYLTGDDLLKWVKINSQVEFGKESTEKKAEYIYRCMIKYGHRFTLRKNFIDSFLKEDE